MIDIHCHILPGVDDGSPNLEYSKKMLDRAKLSGVEKIVCTPHAKDPYFNPQLACEAYESIQNYANSISVKTAFGFEVNWKKLAEIGFDKAPDLAIGNSSYFLLEFSWNHIPFSWENILYELQGRGLKVIIAHPERYSPLWDNYNLAIQLHEAGALFCISGDFIDSRYLGGAPKRIVKRFLKDGIADIVASDAHFVDDYDIFDNSLKFARKYRYNTDIENYISKEIFGE